MQVGSVSQADFYTHIHTYGKCVVSNSSTFLYREREHEGNAYEAEHKLDTETLSCINSFLAS